MSAVVELDEARSRVLEGVWAFRARSELEAAARFRRLAAELADHGADPGVVALAERAHHEEIEHVRICERLAAGYRRGGHPKDSKPGGGAVLPAAPHIGPPSFAPADRLLYEVVAFCCITESINVSLMTVTYEVAKVPEVREAVRAILKDEVSHSRIGWAFLADERRAGRGEFVAAMLPRMIAGAVAVELFSAPRAPDGDERLLAHGELPEAMRLELFEATYRDVLNPGFTSLGIETGAADQWVRARRSQAAAIAPPG